MALSEEARKELTEVMGAAVAAGLAKFRADAEEAEAKKAATEKEGNTGDKPATDGGKFDLGEWFLGG